MRMNSSTAPLTNHFKSTHAAYKSQEDMTGGSGSKPRFSDWSPSSASVGSLPLDTAKPTTQDRLEIKDPVYGIQIVTEPALIELIQSPAVQRLKTILQHGITAVIGMCTESPLTRYEHSVGAMLLVRRAGGPVEAQAAALLHDVAHTALSHVADTVFEYVVHEEDKMEYLATTTVLDILDRHFGAETRHRILDEENYPLLERDAPKLCADRMDYALRDCIQFGTMTLQQAQRIYFDFTTFQNGDHREFACNSVDQALLLSRAYMRCDQIAWANPTHSALYSLAAEAIREALHKGLLTKADLWKRSCLDFWRFFSDSSDARVQELSSLVRSDLQVRPVAADTPLGGSVEEGGRVIALKNKLRTIDPDVIRRNAEGQVCTQKLSELSQEYKDERDHYIQSRSGEFRYILTLPSS